MPDELLDLLKATRQRPIEGDKPRRKGDVIETRPDLTAAAVAVALLLADGQWQKRSRIMTICKANHVTYRTICKHCGIAESASENFVCIPNDTTPERAPDEH